MFFFIMISAFVLFPPVLWMNIRYWKSHDHSSSQPLLVGNAVSCALVAGFFLELVLVKNGFSGYVGTLLGSLFGALVGRASTLRAFYGSKTALLLPILVAVIGLLSAISGLWFIASIGANWHS